MAAGKKQEYHISEEELKTIQEIQQELIGEVKRICKKCGIHFCMVGGTMLGAVRHSGYQAEENGGKSCRN